jgi:hypothetical protein
MIHTERVATPLELNGTLVSATRAYRFGTRQVPPGTRWSIGGVKWCYMSPGWMQMVPSKGHLTVRVVSESYKSNAKMLNGCKPYKEAKCNMPIPRDIHPQLHLKYVTSTSYLITGSR